LEQLFPTWLQEIGRAGLGYVLFLVACWVLWRKDNELQACRTQARDDAIKIAIALEQAAKEIGASTEVERQRVEADKVTAEVLKAVIKQSDLSDERARDRATGIEQRVDAIVARIEAILTRMLRGSHRASD
jgi:hypothetical protein